MTAHHTMTHRFFNRANGPAESDFNAMEYSQISVSFVRTSLGLIAVATTAKGLRAVLFGSSRSGLLSDLRRRFPGSELIAGDTAHRDLTERVRLFIDDIGSDLQVELDLSGTEFEKRVWMAVRDIPVGSTASYSDIARIIGAPATAQDVAAACAANPLAVVVPCHRIVRKDGSLAGYRWGVTRKRNLLAREQALTNPPNGIPLIKNAQQLLRLFESEE